MYNIPKNLDSHHNLILSKLKYILQIIGP
jgi:hypothetical protein